MKKFKRSKYFEALGITVAATLPAPGRAETVALTTPASDRNYLGIVQKFADTLLDKGRDSYGAKKTPMWCAVIDTRDLSVPQKDVPAPAGVREGDRALGGSNLHHDVTTLQVFPVLSAVTGQPRYAQAARDYVASYLQNAQHEETGLLSWGEHCYYNVFDDKPAINEKYESAIYGGMWHELVEWTPPWKVLWDVNPIATTKAISGLRYHFYGAQPGPDLLFNRHAYWNKAEYQPVKGSQPWIKHAGLYTYSYHFLYAKTKDPQTLQWAQGIGEVYWKRRHPQTNLTVSCIDDPRPTSQNATGGLTKLAYWMLKAYHANPQQKELRERSLVFIKAYDRHFYNAQKNGYYSAVTPAGRPVEDKLVQPWTAAYGDPGLLPFGRIAAYFARTEKDADCLIMARRVAQITHNAPMPEKLTTESLAFALNLNLDLYDVTGEKAYLNQARRYADLGIAKFWRNGLFVRQSDDHFYEAKVGTGDLVAGLMRLHLRLHPELKDPGLYDWSF